MQVFPDQKELVHDHLCGWTTREDLARREAEWADFQAAHKAALSELVRPCKISEPVAFEGYRAKVRAMALLHADARASIWKRTGHPEPASVQERRDEVRRTERGAYGSSTNRTTWGT